MPKVQVGEEFSGARVDKVLQAALGAVSRTDVQKLLAAGQVVLDGEKVRKNFKVAAGMELEVLTLPEKEASTLEPEEMPLDIVFEDEDVVVLNKPRGLVVHPGNGVRNGTLASGLLFHFKGALSTVNGPLRPGIVHRLDKDTPGLMLVAKNDVAHRSLAAQLETRSLSRTYRALVWGRPRDAEGTIDAPIGRDPRNRLRQAVTKAGKPARTHYEILEKFSFATLVEFYLETGRTHQIRVHCRHMGTPILGDKTYGGGEGCLTRVQPLLRPVAEKALALAPAQMLQAVKIRFVHPSTQAEMAFEAPPEPVFESILALLRVEAGELEGAEPLFNEFEAGMRFEAEEPEPEEEPECEFPPRKERMTRAERLVKKKERLALKKARELERRKKLAENPAEVFAPGHEPAVDPNLV